jgi:hypothetical protein
MMDPTALKVIIEAADRAAARGAPAQALRLLLAAEPGPIAPDHDHTCPACGGAWSHLDEPCRGPAAPMLCGYCEDECSREHAPSLDVERDPID